MNEIVKHWILWAKTMSASAIPFLRIDFLLQRNQSYIDTEDAGKVEEPQVKVWTGEVSELGVAVELQGMHSHESRDLVMDAVIASVGNHRLEWWANERHRWTTSGVRRQWIGNTWRDASPRSFWQLSLEMEVFLAVAEIYILTLNAETILSSRIVCQAINTAPSCGRLLAAKRHKVLFYYVLLCLTSVSPSLLPWHYGESCLWRQCCRKVRMACC